MIETRIFGPPGTGKTTKLSKEIIPDLAAKYGPEKLMITSFTRAAAEELASRLDIGDSEIIGTLHSICYKALRYPPLTEPNMKEWNKEHPAFVVSKVNSDPGTILMSRYQMLRNKLIPRENWPQKISNFVKAWEAWKQKTGYHDFMDLIEIASGLFSPPGSPAAIVIDEAQDFSRLEMSTLRRWATQVKELWVVGDDLQCLYSFTGASPKNMLEPPLPAEQKIILDQSYRIPASVHRLSEKIYHQIKVKEEKTFKPRPKEGKVTFCDQNIKDADWIIDKALSLPGTSMILASCNYMLNGVIATLKERGEPFSNPWKPEELSWNPLNGKTCQMLIDFLSHGEDDNFWDTNQFLSWAQHIKVGTDGLIRVQGKKGIKKLLQIMEEDPFTPGLHTCREYIDQILTEDAINSAIDRDLNWLVKNMTKDKIQPLSYPIKIYNEKGMDGLTKPAKLFIGTVHSVKGAGSDNVFLCPDVSYAGMIESQTSEGNDNLCRMFYVGVTRTKENLFILAPIGRDFFKF